MMVVLMVEKKGYAMAAWSGILVVVWMAAWWVDH